MHPILKRFYTDATDFKKILNNRKTEIQSCIDEGIVYNKKIEKDAPNILTAKIINITINDVAKKDLLIYNREIYKSRLYTLILLDNMINDTATELDFNNLIQQLLFILHYEIDTFGIIYHKKFYNSYINVFAIYTEMYKQYNRIKDCMDNIPDELL